MGSSNPVRPAVQEIVLRGDFEDWRLRARELLHREVSPDRLRFVEQDDLQVSLTGLFAQSSQFEDLPEVGFKREASSAAHAARNYHVPAAFLAQARTASAFREEGRWALFYRILWRLTHGEPELLSLSIDPDTERFNAMFRSVRRDMHKMTAFVRFREIKARLVPASEGDEADSAITENWFVAWYEPDHRIVRLTAKFFTARFNGMRFSILTPDESLHWDGHRAIFGAGCIRAQAPREDEIEPLWLTYYASIFNPARIKVRAMKKEMAVRYWKNLPEAALIPTLIQQSPARLQAYYRDQQPGVEKFLPPPEGRTLESLREAARNCTACGICHQATQTVFGEGSAHASIVIVGEQPGDQEDVSGRPFVGPAGQLLDRALVLAGIDRDRLYVTNAVKHFKWIPQGKVRLHQRPSASEIATCKLWLAAELAILKPQILICLGVSAAQSILGKAIKLGEIRGRPLRSGSCAHTWVTVHPSAILRVVDPIQQEREFAVFVADLRRAVMSSLTRQDLHN